MLLVALLCGVQDEFSVQIDCGDEASNRLMRVAVRRAASAAQRRAPAPVLNETHGCMSTSPLGVRWAYLQPQHTGTGAAVPFLRQIIIDAGASLAADHSTCQHEHTPQSWRGAVDVAFTFANNPYRRVRTNAVFKGITPDTETPSETEIKAFRSWVAKRGFANLYTVAEEVAKAGVNATCVGQVSRMSEDMRGLLELLGYSLPSSSGDDGDLLKHHCISSCETVDPADRVGKATLAAARTGAGAAAAAPTETNASARSTDWYDEASAAVVQSVFEADFRLYGYSTDPQVT